MTTPILHAVFALTLGVLTTGKACHGSTPDGQFPLDSHGVTVVTHGMNSNIDGWVLPMCHDIAAFERQLGHQVEVYSVQYVGWPGILSSPLFNMERHGPSIEGTAKQIVIAYDWSPFAQALLGLFPDHDNRGSAAALAWLLRTSRALDGVGPEPLAARPVHLIGHSRGGSLVCGTAGILNPDFIVDHLTTLDPRPHPNSTDFPATVASNVQYADNYFQTHDTATYGLAVQGALNEKPFIYDSTLTDVFNNRITYVSDGHRNIHRWYRYGISGVPYAEILPEYWPLYRQWHPTRVDGFPVPGYYFARCAFGVRPQAGLGNPIRSLGVGTLALKRDEKGAVLSWSPGVTGPIRFQTAHEIGTWEGTDLPEPFSMDGRPGSRLLHGLDGESQFLRMVR